MRRPLDWIVTLCLGFLLASQARTHRPPEVSATTPVLRAQLSSVPAGAPATPFAWIQEDGTEVPVPSSAPSPGFTADLREGAPADTEPTSTTHALYTWSAPMSGAESERAWYP